MIYFITADFISDVIITDFKSDVFTFFFYDNRCFSSCCLLFYKGPNCNFLLLKGGGGAATDDGRGEFRTSKYWEPILKNSNFF